MSPVFVLMFVTFVPMSVIFVDIPPSAVPILLDKFLIPVAFMPMLVLFVPMAVSFVSILPVLSSTRLSKSATPNEEGSGPTCVFSLPMSALLLLVVLVA